jgi:hypothetical protein
VTGQLFEPKREFCCSCGWTREWDWHPDSSEHMLAHARAGENEQWWTATDGFADDRKRSRLPEQEAV